MPYIFRRKTINLFPDAEFREDVAEDFVGGDFAGDFAEGVDGRADVLGEHFRRYAVGKSRDCPFDAVVRLR